MLETMSPPIFSFDFSSPYKPSVSSPLSSSPIRAAAASSSSMSSPPAPLSPRDVNSCNFQPIQSSPPIPAPKLFKYASRPAKPNPLRQSRETAQESRRQLFLKNVRQRQDDRQWERRGGDQEVLKLEWSLLDRRRRLQKETDIDGFVFFDEEIEDEIPAREAAAAAGNYSAPGGDVDVDGMMLDAMEQEEDAMLSVYEAEALSLSQPQQPQQGAPPRRPNSPFMSDDEDYENIFMDLLSHQQQENSSLHDYASSGEMDMS